jgi:predicted mannosyl-3-phosphoglycerate phosphatase (HAD superfamily)
MAYQKTICVDFDGTIVDHEFPKIGALKPGARSALQAFRRMGFRIIVWSCRTCKWQEDTFGSWDCPTLERPLVREMIEFLDKEGVPYDEIDDGEKGKPLADLYLDDKALRVEDNWGDVAQWVRENGGRL